MNYLVGFSALITKKNMGTKGLIFPTPRLHGRPIEHVGSTTADSFLRIFNVRGETLWEAYFILNRKGNKKP